MRRPSQAVALPCPDWITWFASGYGGQTPGVNPYSDPRFGQQMPPPKKSYWWVWLLGALGVGGLIVCGCCGAVMWMGFNEFNKAMQQEVAGHPAIQEHIGEIESTSMDFMASAEATEKQGGGNNIIVMDVKGSKGSGELVGVQNPNGTPGNMFSKIDLKTSTGEVISIK